MHTRKVIGTAGLLVGMCMTTASCSKARPRNVTLSQKDAPATSIHAQEESRSGEADRSQDDQRMGSSAPSTHASGDEGALPLAARSHLGEKVRNGDYTMITFASGFVQRNAYYTAAELNDAAYELHFRNNHPVVCPGGEAFVRREVRWYEPIVSHGERCAAVIHVALCKGKKFDQLEAERVRAGLVAMEPEQPIGRGCGAEPANTSHHENMFERQKHQLVETRGDAPCPRGDLTPDTQLQVWPTTRFGARTFIDADLAQRGDVVGNVEFLRRSPEMILGPAAYAAGEPEPQFTESGMVAQQGTNIAIEQRIANAGAGYCIELTATQGSRVWRRSIRRPAGTSPAPVEAGWPMSEPSILRDAHALARVLRASLQTRPFSLKDR